MASPVLSTFVIDKESFAALRAHSMHLTTNPCVYRLAKTQSKYDKRDGCLFLLSVHRVNN